METFGSIYSALLTEFPQNIVRDKSWANYIPFKYRTSASLRNNHKATTFADFAMGVICVVRNGQHLRKKILEYSDNNEIGHPDRKIFDAAANFIRDKTNRNMLLENDADVIILEMHTYLSMCKNCRDRAEEFIREVEESIGVGKIKLRVSYKIQYFKEKGSPQNHSSCFDQSNRATSANILQEQIEFLTPETEADNLKREYSMRKYTAKSVFISKGMNRYYGDMIRNLEDRIESIGSRC